MKKIDRRQALKLTAAAASSLCFSPAYAQTQKKRKIAFNLLFSPDVEAGWDYAHVQGLEQARATFGDRVQIDVFYEVPAWGNGDKEHLEKQIADGYEMIFNTSFGYLKSTVEVALANPTIIFEHCTGYIRAKNISTYNIRWYEGRTIEGFLAGSLSKSNRVGYVGSHPIPEVICGINAAYLAARSVNPEIKFDIIWLSEWLNYEKEAEAAQQLIDRGADILMHHTDSTAPVEVAQKNGVYGFGEATDMAKYGPNTTMTSMINNWGNYYVRRIGEFLNNTWKTESTWEGLGGEMFTMGPLLETLPKRTLLKTQDITDRLTTGKLHAFAGPIRKQDGAGWLAPGETASDSDILTMDYYTEGMVSVYPSNN